MTKREAVKKYLCPGCVCGIGPHDPCYNEDSQRGCRGHVAGSMIFPVGCTVALGLPNGFNRVKSGEDVTRVYVFSSFDEVVRSGCAYNQLNVPVWAHVDEHGSTLVRVYMPRRNTSQIHVILENCIDRVKPVHTITAKDIKEMD